MEAKRSIVRSATYDSEGLITDVHANDADSKQTLRTAPLFKELPLEISKINLHFTRKYIFLKHEVFIVHIEGYKWA